MFLALPRLARELVAVFVVFAGYIGTTLAFTALYLARMYKNGLQRPNAFINHKGSSLQPPLQVLTETGTWMRAP
jgi:hypothetical protein